jgi:hypothetical protein
VKRWTPWTPRGQLGLALLFAVAIPAASWLQGSGALAYRMYARSASYRIRVTAWDERGRAEPVAPTALAARAHGAAREYLAGADHWLNFPRGQFLVDHLDELARLACTTARAPARASVEIDLRPSFDGPIETRSRAEVCR